MDTKETADVMDDKTAALLIQLLEGDFPATSQVGHTSNPACGVKMLMLLQSEPVTVKLFSSMKNLFNSCMDEAAIKKEGLSDLLSVVDQDVQ